jgi:TniQ
MAVRMRTGPGWVVRELGVELLPGGSGSKPLNYGISMSSMDLDAVRAATGVVPEAVSAMLLSAYDGTVLDLSPLGRGPAGGPGMRGAWGLFRGSRCCPECVMASDGAWRLWWRLGGAVACPEHRVLLHGRCPRCRLPLRQNWGWLMLATFPANGLSACMNRPDSGRDVCGFPLAELPARPATAEVLEVQDLYLSAANGQMLRLAGKEVVPADWFAEMSQLAALARWAGPQELPGAGVLPGHLLQVWRDDHAVGQEQRRWLWRGCPPSPELTAALLQVLSPVLRAASEPEFRDAASWLISAAYRRWAAPRRNAHSPAEPALLPPFTRRAFMTSQHRGNPKVFLGKFLHPEPALARQGLTAAHVPCYLLQDDVLEQVTPHLAPKRGARPGGRQQQRFAALCLVMMISDVPTWDAAAEALGLPPLTTNSNPSGYLLIADLLAFREGLIVLGNRLVERGLIDYRARRAALAGLTELPAGDWAGRPAWSKPERYDRGRVFAAAWIWSEFTGGYYDESPAWAAHPEPSTPAPPMAWASSFYYSWRIKMGAARRDWLRSWGARYLEERG